jgi:hypothetical protein
MDLLDIMLNIYEPKGFIVLNPVKLCAFMCLIVLFATTYSFIENAVCCALAQEPTIESEPMEQRPLSPTTSGQLGWINENKDTLSISTESDGPISGNSSLRVDVQPASTINETVDSPWSVISSDFIPVRDSNYLEYSLNVAAKDVNQLHSKVYYYDSNKKEITWDFIFAGRDGTFQDSFKSSFATPKQAEYLKIQMWVKKSLKPSSFLLDDVKIQRTSAEDK